MELINSSLIPPLEPTVTAPTKEKHKMTLTIEDVDLQSNQIDIIVKHEPELNQNVPMTAALNVAQQVLELLTIIRQKNMTPQ